MSRKRTNLDTSEANYIYAHVLLELNKYEKFKDLFVTERNKLVDEICLEVIEMANNNEDYKEALKFEILAYKLQEKGKKEKLLSSYYINNIVKPKNFNDLMKTQYEKVIKQLVAKKNETFSKVILKF